MKPTLATPVLATSKPAARNQFDDLSMYQYFCLQPPPPPLEDGVKSSRFNLASFAFNCPR